MNVSQITKRQVYRLFMQEAKRCKKEGLSNTRVNAFLTNMRSFFSFGIKRLGLDYKNPCTGIAKLPIDRRVKFIPTQEMVDEVIAKCTPEQASLIRFLDETGARVSEALNVSLNDWKNGKVVLYTRKSKNGDLVPRVVPCTMNPQTFDWDRRPDFLKYKTREWSYHALRHKRASEWANEGKPLIQIMALLGHQNISTTQIYLRSLGANLATENF